MNVANSELKSEIEKLEHISGRDGHGNVYYRKGDVLAAVEKYGDELQYWKEQYHMLRGTWDGIFDGHRALTWPPPDHILKAIAGRRRHFALLKALEDWRMIPPEKRDPAMLEHAVQDYLMDARKTDAMPKALKDDALNMIRGKNLVGQATPVDVSTLFDHIDALELLLDEADEDDLFGTEGWRHRLGIDE